MCKIRDTACVHLLQVYYRTFSFPQSSHILVINTGNTSDQQHQFECSVQLARPNISPEIIL